MPNTIGAIISRARSAGVTPTAPFPIPHPEDLELPDAVVAHLSEVQAQASMLRGPVGVGDPRRLASAHMAADTQALLDQGFKLLAIARALGVQHGAISQRLERYGFRAPSVGGTPAVALADLPPLHEKCPVLERELAYLRV